jgi:hypothetical protein
MESAAEVTAVLGGAAAPVVMVDAMVDEFEQIVRACRAAAVDDGDLRLPNDW